MKKICCVMIMALLLGGCGSPESFETMSDVYQEAEATPQRQVYLELPQEAAVTVMENGVSGKIYLCEDYCVSLQTLAAGDLDATFRSVTGFSREKLPVMERMDGEYIRYEAVWACAGEGGDQVGRTLVLDDGSYHYTLTVTADAENAGDLIQVWQAIFDSFSLEV